jgi:hypothetical protein
MAKGKWQRANGKWFSAHLKFAVCHLPFEVLFSRFPMSAVMTGVEKLQEVIKVSTHVGGQYYAEGQLIVTGKRVKTAKDNWPEDQWQKANGKEQMANDFRPLLKFAVCHLPFEILFSRFPMSPFPLFPEVWER